MMSSTIFSALLSAVITVESNGNPDAVGKHGEVGVLQIQMGVIHDVNASFGTHYKSEDRKDPVISKVIFRLYLKRWNALDTPEAACRVWHGGPEGRNKPHTKAYWHKVKEIMERSHKHHDV